MKSQNGKRINLPSYENLAERLSGITGERIIPNDLISFEKAQGSNENPITIKPCFNGISREYHGGYFSNFELNISGKTFISQIGYKKSDFKKIGIISKNEIVRCSLKYLIKTYERPSISNVVCSEKPRDYFFFTNIM